MLRFFTIVAVICSVLPHASRADDGYGDGGGYEAPPPKTKFNIGFNLPAMSISLPKLELPQISIKASVKNKKPFVLKMPVIKFNAHASTEEEGEYGPGPGYGPPPPPAYGEGDGGAYPSGPSAYASSPNGISGYASSLPETPAYAASAANPKLGYERPAASAYNDAAGQSQPQAYPSGYSSAADQGQNAQSPYVPKYSRPVQPAAPQLQPASYAPQNQAYTPQHVFTPQHAYQIQPQQAPQLQSTVPSYQSSPAVTANGYHVPRPAPQANQLPEYRDENVKYYQAAPLYQSEQPSAGSGPLVEEFYNGARLRPANYGRRSNRQYVEHMGGVFLASASDNDGPIFLTPYTQRMDMLQWNPLMMGH